jgi:hypothetical protein
LDVLSLISYLYRQIDGTVFYTGTWEAEKGTKRQHLSIVCSSDNKSHDLPVVDRNHCECWLEMWNVTSIHPKLATASLRQPDLLVEISWGTKFYFEATGWPR